MGTSNRKSRKHAEHAGKNKDVEFAMENANQEDLEALERSRQADQRQEKRQQPIISIEHDDCR
ncbi:YfhD family protein [Paenibacillus sediminis]|uniref:YfhD family protein n=1 Tax=Paenibacillus sediminis TaxID=664909 RepID=A0ABS4GZS5_9BACL|nr:YfhD family protein [Paenibacillus sediminis]MBP1935380.1 hypothetical protein [Paenibacillus sediminis]